MADHLRRTVLTAIGTLTAGAIGVGATEKRQSEGHDSGGFEADCESCRDTCESKPGCARQKRKKRGVLYVENHSKCPVAVNLRTHAGSHHMTVAGHDWDELTFEGRITGMDIEDGDVDVWIEQRSEHNRNHCQ